MDRYQFVRWGRWVGLGFVRLDPNRTDLAGIYVWRLYLGFFEVRRWTE